MWTTKYWAQISGWITSLMTIMGYISLIVEGDLFLWLNILDIGGNDNWGWGNSGWGGSGWGWGGWNFWSHGGGGGGKGSKTMDTVW